MSLLEYPEFELLTEYQPEYHDIYTVCLGELYQDGWFDPFSDESWKWDFYSEEQYERVIYKFLAHYWDRELGIMPPGKWKRRYVNFMNEIMPKYKYAYELIDKGVNILQDSDEYTKNRRIFSEFPATQLQADVQDYASNANDFENETVRYGNFIDTMGKLRYYNDIDLMIVEDCERLFTCFFSVNINSW